MGQRLVRQLAKRVVFGTAKGWPFTERFRLGLRAVAVAVPDLPPALWGLRVGLLTDLHVGWYAGPAQAERAVALLNGARPDLALVAGDLVHDGTGQADLVGAARAVGAIAAPLGVYGVLGNHCYWAGAHRVEAALHDAGVPVLANRGLALPVRESRLWLAGLDSAFAGSPDVAAAMAGAAAGRPGAGGAAGGGFCLLAVHEPDYADEAVRAMPDGLTILQLSGHSHGGQIRLPGLSAYVAPALGRKYVRGLYRVNGDRYQVYTSPGVGVTGVPMRWGSPPEVTVVVLTPAGG
ncbi:MAG TPA: metallophosphoesterase [Symbiobacteriaceae bacterium]|nr:metallophosphoesterase [Symbiobacteriaceae bacterium]